MSLLIVTSQFWLSSNNGQGTKTFQSRRTGPGREVLNGSPGKRGELFFSQRALREAAQRANRKGSSNPGTRGEGHATAVGTPA